MVRLIHARCHFCAGILLNRFVVGNRCGAQETSIMTCSSSRAALGRPCGRQTTIAHPPGLHFLDIFLQDMRAVTARCSCSVRCTSASPESPEGVVSSSSRIGGYGKASDCSFSADNYFLSDIHSFNLQSGGYFTPRGGSSLPNQLSVMGDRSWFSSTFF